ncbi:LD-carboxypeptidase [Clostridium sp. PL3]|uniref:LD-carboxypeptidase n=1 Tax=Clostridium thailandense TaxID=2794346 RepID=A0A949U303_9CLOT|nr:LD-carboxypeptidase [Clostridium thailandense]MBV7275429.1 LD-carboxypeptidase [Clostridium thailandense]
MLAKRLRKGDTIGLVSPAGPENADKIKKSIGYIKSLGFNIKEGKHIYDKIGYLAGKDTDRAKDLMDMFEDKEVDMILCVRGGYGSMRILPLIDFETIKQNPKIFAGFSDITTLLNNIWSKCGLITFHSPMCNSNLSDKDTLDSFLKTLMFGNEPYTINNPSNMPIKCFSPEPIISGQLVGGNLSLLCSTIGSKFEVNTKDKLLFIEDVGEDPYKIDRMLTQLILCGKLDKCKGIVLGQFTNCELPHYERSLTLDQVIEDRILSLKKPTLTNIQSGHSYPKLTLPIGAKIKINFVEQKIEVLQPVVS